MKILWTAEEVAAAIGANAPAPWEATGVSIDSRTIQPGEIFVALVGERFDGHDYVRQALENGAVAAVVSKDMDVPGDALLQVDDTNIALQQMGVAARRRFAGKVIGVTGSVGKTGCKEMLRHVLDLYGRVHATKGNLNNHYGVPLSLANMPRDDDFAVMEMGMNHAGEIAQLSGWVKPDVSIITTVEAVHLENFDSVEAIADAKAEIFSGMQGEGVAVLNVDNAHINRLRQHAEDADLDRILAFGTAADAHCQMLQYRIEGLQSVIDAVIAGTRVEYRVGAIGKHWGMMSVAVLGIIDALGLDIAKAAESLAHFNEPEGRGNITQLKVHGGYLRLINDAYNASPVSMAAAFEKMADMAQLEPVRPRMLAVLGDMLELGDNARELHVGLVPTMVNNQIDLVFAAGQFMKHLYDALPESMRGAYQETAKKLAPKVIEQLQPNDLVLVKGSHGSKMGDVVKAMQQESDGREREDKLDAL